MSPLKIYKSMGNMVEYYTTRLFVLLLNASQHANRIIN